MHATPATAPHWHWTPRQIAEAVPLRLFELDLRPCDAGTLQAANRIQPRRRRNGYLPGRTLPALFRVHG